MNKKDPEFSYIKFIKRTIGIILIAIGILGIFLPILQGLILIFAGLLLLGIKTKEIKKWIKKIKNKIKGYF